MKKSKIAFTLAEVLITLSIIGIVAATTIPTIIQNTQDTELKIAWKKAYSEASNVWNLVQTENPGAYTTFGGWGPPAHCISPNDDRWDKFKEKFKRIKECTNTSGCWAQNAEDGINASVYLESTTKYGFVSSDGMYWTHSFDGIDSTHVGVDVNGEKGPNKWGKDMYAFLLQPGKITISLGSTDCVRHNEPFTINGRSVYFTKPLLGN